VKLHKNLALVSRKYKKKEEKRVSRVRKGLGLGFEKGKNAKRINEVVTQTLNSSSESVPF
jgi:hypothetical protein